MSETTPARASHCGSGKRSLRSLAENELPPEPAPIRIPWRSIASWTVSFGVILWAFLLLPGVVRDVRERALVDVESAGPEYPTMPEDPPLSAKVQDLMRQGKQAEADGRLPLARSLYFEAFEAEPRCFSCAYRRRMVEARIEDESSAALEAGAKYLEEARWADAAAQYAKVLNIVPHKKANFHVLAANGLKEARAGAIRSGRPLP